MFGMRRWLPLPGVAGGAPGATNQFLVHRAEGPVEQLDVNATGVVLQDGDWFEMRLPNGGGFGDPLDREPALVEADVAEGRFSPADAAHVYGVMVGDAAATARQRAQLRQARLARAQAPARPVGSAPPPDTATALPLFPGVVQCGPVAYAAESGAPLAVAPDHWTDGCPVLMERLWDDGPGVEYRTYLDPGSGRALHVEVVLDGAPRSFTVLPDRWTAERREAE
jgi:N-methylhydantoinase B